MNPEVKAKWVTALRSGNYRQGQDYLRSSGDAFCCLGVLCDLAVKEGVIPEPVRNSAAYEYTEDHCSTLPRDVGEWAGFTPDDDTGPYTVIDGDCQSLATHNDSGRPFDVIADAIEAQL